MAKTNKNKRSPKKRKSLDKSSSAQKENRPKKIKTNKPNPDETIAMSKQLLMKKKSVQNKTRTKRLSKSNNNRVCGNGKIMPSLADLEKFFEDSDDDSDENIPKITPNNYPIPPSTPQKEPTVLDLDTLISPSTRSRITEQVKEVLLTIDNSNLHDSLEEPPMKRLKFDTHDIEWDEASTTSNTNSVAKMVEATEKFNDNQMNSYQSEINSGSSNTETKLLTESGNVSDSSNDTIEYKLNPSTLPRISVSHEFCPLPSTSKDNNTFIKNDELFSKSLRESSINNRKLMENNNIQITKECMLLKVDDDIKTEASDSKEEVNLKSEVFINNDEDTDNKTVTEISERNDTLPENDDTDLQIIEIPTETISILDEIKNEPLDSITTNNTDKHKLDAIDVDADDDDCIFVETQIVPKQASIDPEVIDLEYDFIEPVIDIDNNKTYEMDDDVIDVDALIAQNQSILSQYKPETKNLDSTNLVVDVDVSTITENTSTNTHITSINNDLDVEPANPRNTQNMQDETENDLITLPAIVADSSSNVDQLHRPNRAPNRRKRNRQHPYSMGGRCTDQGASSQYLNPVSLHNSNLIMNYVQDFFSGYRPPDNFHRHSTPLNLDVPIFNALPFPPSSNRADEHNRISVQNNNNIPSSLWQQINDVPQTSSNEVHSTISLPPEPTHNSVQTPKKKRKSHKTSDNLAPPIPPSPSQEKPAGNLGDCPICMDSLSGKVIASTICGHVFCMRCLQQAIAANKRCPTCRKILNKKNGYHQIFL